MIVTEQGTVVEVKAGRAVVKTRPTESCDHCTAKSACHTMGGGGKVASLEVDDPVGVRIGDWVEIAVEGQGILVGSFLFYMVPVLALLIGVILGPNLAPDLGLGKNEAAILVGGGLAVVTGAAAWLLGRHLSQQPKYRARILKVLPAGPE